MFVDYLDRGSGLDPQARCMVAPDGTVLMTHEEFTAVSHGSRWLYWTTVSNWVTGWRS